MAGVLSLPLVLASCSDDVDVAGTGVSTDSGVESAFDFSSTADLTVSISYPAYANVEVYDKIPDGKNDAKLLYRTVTGANGKFKTKVTLPAKYIGKKVYAIAVGAGCPLVTEATVTAEGLNIAAKSSKVVYNTISNYTEEEISTINAGIDHNLPNEEHNYYRLQNYVKGENIDITLDKDADQVVVTFLRAEGYNDNSLYYYVYSGSGSVNINNFINDDYKVFGPFNSNPSETNMDKNAGRHAGYSVILTKGAPENDMKFKAGDKIGFILVSNDGTIRKFATNKEFNDNSGNYDQCARFVYNNEAIVYTFEDRPVELGTHWAWGPLFGDHYGYWFRELPEGDFNDFTFMVKANPSDAISDEDIPDLPTPPFYTSSQSAPYEGTVAFEDLYPSQGDYDMNDFVSRYSLVATTYVLYDPETETIQPPHYLGRVDYEFTPVWDGAAYGCDFNFILEMGNDSFSQSYKREQVHVYTLEANGVMNAIDVEPIRGAIDCGFEFVIDSDGSERCVAGVELGYDKEPTITWSTMFNPYITVSNTNYEVHLPNMPASPDATGLEGLDEYTRAYLVEGGNFPFAVNVPSANFKVAPERECINKYYPKYDNWVKSNGQEDSDWYDYPRE